MHLCGVVCVFDGARAVQKGQGCFQIVGGGQRLMAFFLVQNYVAGERKREVEENKTEGRAPPVCKELYYRITTAWLSIICSDTAACSRGGVVEQGAAVDTQRRCPWKKHGPEICPQLACAVFNEIVSDNYREDWDAAEQGDDGEEVGCNKRRCVGNGRSGYGSEKILTA